MKILNKENFKCDDSKIFDFLISPINQRKKEKNIDKIPVFFVRYLGVSENKNFLLNKFWQLEEDLKEKKYIRIQSPMSFDLTNQVSFNIQNLIKNKKDFNNTPKDWIYIIKLSSAFHIFKDFKVYEYMQDTFLKVLNIYFVQNKNISVTATKNFVLKFIAWIYEYGLYLLENWDPVSNEIEINPTILFWGTPKKHETYFLLYMSFLAIDVIYFSFSKEDPMEIIDINQEFSFKITENSTEKNLEFPLEKLPITEKTIALEASEELENILYNAEDGIIKSWQLENFDLNTLDLRTTYDELKLLWNQQSMFRSGFKVEKNMVFVPRIFTKIIGVLDSLSDYKSEIEFFKTSQNSIEFEGIKIHEKEYNPKDLLKYKQFIKDDLSIDIKKLERSKQFEFYRIKKSMKTHFINKIEFLIKNKSLFLNCEMDIFFKERVLASILELNPKILDLILSFDFAFDIPKIIILDFLDQAINLESSIVLMFIYLMGLDVLIFTPGVYENVEIYIKEDIFQLHKFTKLDSNLNLDEFKSISVNKRKRILDWILKK